MPEFPSVTVTSLIESAGTASSSAIVPSPLASKIDAFDALLNPTANVSLASLNLSPFTVTENVCVIYENGKFTSE